MNDEQIITAQIPGPGSEIDDYTVMAEKARLDLSARPPIMQWGFQGNPIGRVLDIWREGNRVFMKAKVNLKDITLPPNVDIEFHPGFIVRELRVIDGKRIINAADLVHISMGFKYTSESRPWWKRLWAWVRGLVVRLGGNLRLTAAVWGLLKCEVGAMPQWGDFVVWRWIKKRK